MIAAVKPASLLVVPAAVTLTLSLAGCSTVQQAFAKPSPSALAAARLEEGPVPGQSAAPGATDPAGPRPFASTADGRLWLVVYGSSSCRAVPTGLRTDNTHEVEITLTPSPQEMCTADLAPNAMSFPLAGSGLTLKEPVTVHVKGLAEPLDLVATPVR